MKRLSIVHLITGLGAGGAEHVLVRAVSAMRRDRFTNLVVSLMPEGPLAMRLRAAGIEVHALDMTPGWPSPRAAWRLVRLLRERRPDVLQTWMYHADLMGLAMARAGGVRTVVWNVRAADMDMSHYRAQSRWTVAACARAARFPRAVVVNSDAGRVHHQRLGYHPREWIVIPNGVDVSAFRPDDEARRSVRAALGIPIEAPVIGLIARFDPMKDHETFLRAAAQLAAARPDVRFLLAGDGVDRDTPAFSELLARTAPNAHVLALGRRDDVPRIAAACDVSTCSSITEGFPNAVIESMACGVPCVVTDVGDAAEIVGETGVVVPPRDPPALAGGFAHLLELPASDRIALGARARQRIIDRYTLARMVATYEALYERVG